MSLRKKLDSQRVDPKTATSATTGTAATAASEAGVLNNGYASNATNSADASKNGTTPTAVDKTPRAEPMCGSAGGWIVPWSYLGSQFSHERIAPMLEDLRAFVPTGDFTLGEPLTRFEEKFAKLIGSRHAIGVNSGTDAIKLSLRAVGVGHGDEVITAANTFIATVGAIAELGAKPVFVDCLDTFCLDVTQVEWAITPKTRALLPVHLAGQMTDMRELMPLAEKYRLPVVEDACQAILANIDGRVAGTFGRSGCFSLHPLKNLNVWGDGGVIVTDDDEMATLLRTLRNHGLANRDEVVTIGYNSRLDTVQAIVANRLVDQVPEITKTRERYAAILDEGLRQIAGITIPARDADRRRVYHLYIVFAEQRDALLAHCLGAGIEAKVHYPIPVYRQSGVAALCGGAEGDFPTTDRHARTMISFPAHDHLSQEQLLYIIDTVDRFYRAAA